MLQYVGSCMYISRGILYQMNNLKFEFSIYVVRRNLYKVKIKDLFAVFCWRALKLEKVINTFWESSVQIYNPICSIIRRSGYLKYNNT